MRIISSQVRQGTFIAECHGVLDIMSFISMLRAVKIDIPLRGLILHRHSEKIRVSPPTTHEILKIVMMILRVTNKKRNLVAQANNNCFLLSKLESQVYSSAFNVRLLAYLRASKMSIIY